MNVTDVHPESVQTQGDRLNHIFDRQSELMEKYGPIERRNGNSYKTHVHSFPADLNDRHAQSLCKDFAWRVTEELAEASEAMEQGDVGIIHAQEEVADAFHFLVELCLVVGIMPVDIVQASVSMNEDQVGKLCRPAVEDQLEVLCRPAVDRGIFADNMRYGVPARSAAFDGACYEVVKLLGLAMNTLKQKPWKQTAMLTDVRRFKFYLVKAFQEFPCVAARAGLDYKGLHSMYFRKSEVNKFRQNSNY